MRMLSRSASRLSRVQASHRQVLVGVVIVIAAIAVLVSLPTGPLAAAIERKRDEVAHKRLLLEGVRRHAADNQVLSKTGLPRSTGDARGAVEKVLARIGVQASPGASGNSDGQTRVVIVNASFDDVVRAIDTLAREEALHLVDGTITRLVDRGRVRADLVFAR